MALVVNDRVQQTGTANTTVSFTLSGSVTGYQSFSAVGNGNTTYYAATDSSGNWEVGVGTYATGGTLTRTTILSSSNSGSAVTFSGTVNVFVTYPSEKSINLDGSGNASPLGTITSGTWQAATIGVAYGGTGATTLTGYIKGSGTSAFTGSSTIPTTDLSGTVTNAQLANSAITINGTSTSLGGSISVGTVTSVAATAGTGISVTGSPITSSGTLTITNTAPDQTVALANGTGISVTGTYPNFTVTNTAPSSGGTVTSVTATAPVASTGGTTPVISMPAATTSVSGYLTSTDWNTFNGKGNGTVTSVSGTGTVNGLTLSGTVTSSGSLTLSGSVTGVANTAKAWAQALGGTSSPLTINGSFNVSSITRTALGKYVVNFTSSLANANYSVVASSSSTQSSGIFALPFYTAAGTISAPTTSSFPILYLGTNGAPFDVDYVNFAVFD